MEANKHKVFARFLLSYVLILLVPLLVGSLGLTEAERVVRTYATETSQSILEQIRDILDTRTAELKKMATLLALNPMVRSLVEEQGPISSQARFDIWELSHNLQSYQLTETFLTTFFLYYKNIGMVISPYTASPVSTFYGYSLEHNGLNMGQWEEVIFGRYYGGEFLPATPMKYEGNDYSIIPYILSLPMGQREHPGAALVMLINEAQIRQLLARVMVYDQGWVYVEDRQGRIVTSVAGLRATVRTVEVQPLDARHERRIAGRPMTIIQTTSSYNGWRYVAVLPTTAVMGRVRYVRILTVGVTLFSLLIGLLMAYYLAYRNVKPLREIVHSLTGLFDGGIDRGGTEYEVLRGTLSAIRTVITDNKSLRHAVERQRPLLKAAVMDSLLKGRYRNLAEVESELAHVDWEVRDRNYLVMIVRIARFAWPIGSESLRELDYIRVFIESNLMPTALSEAYLHHIDRGSFAVLLSSGTSDPDGVVAELGPSIRELVDLMFRNYGIRIQCALGGVCDSLLRVCHSFDQARQAADYQTIREGIDVVWYGMLPSENVRYYYPMDLEERLIYLTNVGQKQEVKKILGEIRAENFKRRELSMDITQQLLHELRGTADKVTNDGISDEIRDKCRVKLMNTNSIADFFKTLEGLLSRICDLANTRAKNGLRNLMNGITGYIKMNYMNTQLSLTTVAAHFGHSPVYLSQLFKEETGENFSDYLERIRMEHASQLLADPRLSVGDIARQLGYNSDKVFRRAFKRVKGTSPTDYRQAILPGN